MNLNQIQTQIWNSTQYSRLRLSNSKPLWFIKIMIVPNNNNKISFTNAIIKRRRGWARRLLQRHQGRAFCLPLPPHRPRTPFFWAPRNEKDLIWCLKEIIWGEVRAQGLWEHRQAEGGYRLQEYFAANRSQLLLLGIPAQLRLFCVAKYWQLCGDEAQNKRNWQCKGRRTGWGEEWSGAGAGGLRKQWQQGQGDDWRYGDNSAQPELGGQQRRIPDSPGQVRVVCMICEYKLHQISGLLRWFSVWRRLWVCTRDTPLVLFLNTCLSFYISPSMLRLSSSSSSLSSFWTLAYNSE